MKKGRHRRFEEARSLKRSVATANRRCPECGAEPDDKHASWCLATEDDYDEILGTAPRIPPRRGRPAGRVAGRIRRPAGPGVHRAGQRRTVGWGSRVTGRPGARRSSR